VPPGELRAGQLVSVSNQTRGQVTGVVIDARPPAELPAIAGQYAEHVRAILEGLDVDQVALIEHRHDHRQVAFFAIHRRGAGHWQDLLGQLLTIVPSA
jgi:hypothetical protein